MEAFLPTTGWSKAVASRISDGEEIEGRAAAEKLGGVETSSTVMDNIPLPALVLRR